MLCVYVQVSTAKDVYIFNYVDLYLYATFPTGCCLFCFWWLLGDPPKGFDPYKIGGDNDYTSIQMLVVELKCILLMAKK